MLPTFRILAFALLAACTSSAPSNPSNPSTACESSDDCTNPDRAYCVRGVCQACDGPSACTPDAPRCAPDTLTCGACTGDEDCGEYPGMARCAPDGACVTCVTDAHCDNPTPICDTAAQGCRACQADDECASRVCNLDTGACVATADVVYASPDGTAIAACSLAEPCSLTRAVAAASASAIPPILRMLPGEYTSLLRLETPVSLSIVGTDATLKFANAPDGLGRLLIQGGAALRIRNLAIETTLQCGNPSLPDNNSLSLVDTQVVSNSFAVSQCTLRIARSTLSGVSSWSLGDNATLEVDRSRFEGARFRGFGRQITARITSSVFTGALGSPIESFSDQPSNVTPPRKSTYELAFNTIYGVAPCPANTANLTVVYENNIIVANDPELPFAVNLPASGATCTMRNNLLFPEVYPPSMLPSGNPIADPRLVDLANGDFRLQPNSPAIDMAVPPSTGLGSTHDVTGATRPYGAASDIGAHEYRP